MTLSSLSTSQLPIVTVNVNRPFIFYIINRLTKTSLFSGQVHNLNLSTQQTNLMNTPQENIYRITPIQSNTINSPPIGLKQTYQQPQPTDQKSIVYPINVNPNN